MDEIQQKTGEIMPLTDDDFETIAKKLEEMCEKTHAFSFYSKLRELPSLCKRLKQVAAERLNPQNDFKKFGQELRSFQTTALDFFMALDEELGESVWNVLEDLENTTLYVKKPGEKEGRNEVVVREITAMKRKKPYTDFKIEIFLEPRNDTLGAITVAHELAHTMEERIQKRMPQKTHALCEIVPMFMEKVFAEHLVEIGMIDKQERDKVFERFQNSLIKSARMMVEEQEIFGQLHGYVSAQKLKGLMEKCEDETKKARLHKRLEMMAEEDDKYHGQWRFRYVIGEFVSAELFEDYKKDPQKTLEKVKLFAQNNAHITAQKGLKMLLGENFEERLGFEISRRKS